MKNLHLDVVTVLSFKLDLEVYCVLSVRMEYSQETLTQTGPVEIAKIKGFLNIVIKHSF